MSVRAEKFAVLYITETICIWMPQKKIQNVKISFATVPLKSIAYKYPKPDNMTVG
jgi:hypothetical protein